MTNTIGKLQVTNIETLEIFAFFYMGIALSAILNPFAAKKFARDLFLLGWIFVGAFASALLLVLDISVPTSAFAVSLFLGCSIGIGLPSCLAYFADTIHLENRGKIGGIIWAGVGIIILLFAALSSFLDYRAEIVLFTFLRLCGLLFFFLKPRQQMTSLGRDHSYSSILTDSNILFYLIPWIMFSLINWIESPIVQKLFGEELYTLITFGEVVISGFFALVAGLFSDLVGRKRIIIVGFIMLGIEYAVLSFLQGVTISGYIYVFLDGISWGMFSVVFFIVLWGDLAKDGIKEKYYVIGGLPYLLAGFLRILVGQYVESISINTAFSLASFFLFLAILPLIYAPETLPEKKIQQRQIKKYAEEAKKVVEKEAGKE
jgi:MFS family permease